MISVVAILFFWQTFVSPPGAQSPPPTPSPLDLRVPPLPTRRALGIDWSVSLRDAWPLTLMRRPDLLFLHPVLLRPPAEDRELLAESSSVNARDLLYLWDSQVSWRKDTLKVELETAPTDWTADEGAVTVSHLGFAVAHPWSGGNEHPRLSFSGIFNIALCSLARDNLTASEREHLDSYQMIVSQSNWTQQVLAANGFHSLVARRGVDVDLFRPSAAATGRARRLLDQEWAPCC